MPAIAKQRALEKREWSNTVGQSGMTPTAFAFLIPVFVVVVFAPFLCVFCIRRRQRAAQPLPARRPVKIKKPALRRAEARERLKHFTDVLDVTGKPKSPVDAEVEEREEAPVVPDSSSISEPECAICLSALDAPAPPEPALLAPTDASNADEAATNPIPPSTDEQPQATLKLRACAHTFHAECLVSWFVLRKTTCPICRTAYISKEDMQAYEEEEAAETAVVETMVVVEPTAAQRTQPPVTNWRYFWAGQSVMGREHALAATRQGVTDVESGQQRERRWRLWRAS